MGIPPAGYIAPCRINRDLLLAGMEAGHNFKRAIRRGRLLCFGEAADVFVGKPDVRLELFGHLCRRIFDGGIRYPDLAVPFIKLAGQIAHSVLATLLDFCKQAFNLGADIGLTTLGLFG